MKARILAVFALASLAALGLWLLTRRGEAPSVPAGAAQSPPRVLPTSLAASSRPSPPPPSRPWLTTAPSSATTRTLSEREDLPLPASSARITTQPLIRYELRLVVVDKNGDPAPGADVALVWRQGESPMRVHGQTDSLGRFQTNELPVPEIDTLIVGAPGFIVWRQANVPIPPGPLTVVLERLPSIRGVVLELDGQPFSGAFTAMVLAAAPALEPGPREAINLAPPRPSVVAMERFVGREGEFEFPRLAPGTYAVAVWVDASLGGVSPWFEIRAGEMPQALRIPLASQLRISGTVLLKNEANETPPLPGAKVTAANYAAAVAPETSQVAAGLTDPQGAYVIEGLPAGAYEVAASPEAPSIEPGAQSAVLLRPDAPSNVDFLLVRKPIRLAGEVVGESEEPLPGAEVLLLRPPPHSTHRQSVAGASGRFEFDGLSEGTYQLGVGHPADPSRQKMFEIVVQGAGPERIELRFYPRTRVVGRVYRAGLPSLGRTIRFSCKPEQANPWVPACISVIEVPISPESGTYEALLEPGPYEAAAGVEPARIVVVQPGPEPVYRFDLSLP